MSVGLDPASIWDSCCQHERLCVICLTRFTWRQSELMIVESRYTETAQATAATCLSNIGRKSPSSLNPIVNACAATVGNDSVAAVAAVAAAAAAVAAAVAAAAAAAAHVSASGHKNVHVHKRYHERKQNLSYHPQTMEFQLQRRGVCTFVPCHLPGQKNTLALTVAARHVGTRPSTQQSRKM
jgi:hypothetical protein